ncbi:Maf family protein [Chloroflexota bacterium]
MKRVILASASPRRIELLRKIGLQCEVEPSDYKEVFPPGTEPHELTHRLSLKKAQAIAARHRDAVVIAADTIGVLDGHILGKPHTVDDARRMLQTLSGRAHSVITGFSIIDTGTNKIISRSVETRVFVKIITPAEIDAYVKTGEPLDKAGAYAIQGLGAVFIERIEGDYFNVIGFPLNALAEALREFGISIIPVDY